MSDNGLFTRPEYRNADIANIDNRASKELKALCKKYLLVSKEKYFEERTNIYLCGEYRVGKTWFFHALANFLIKKFGEKSVYYITAPKIQELFQKNKEWQNGYTWKEYLKSIKILFIDDLGLEYRGANTGFIETELENLIRHRYNYNRITYIASNADTTTLAKTYGKSFAEFIESEYVVFDIEKGVNIGEKIRNDKLRHSG